MKDNRAALKAIRKELQEIIDSNGWGFVLVPLRRRNGQRPTLYAEKNSDTPGVNNTRQLIRGYKRKKLIGKELVENFDYYLNYAKKNLLDFAEKCYSSADRKQIKMELDNHYPVEMSKEEAKHYEGFTKRVYVNKYERNKAARKECIDHFKAICMVCQLDFGKIYGKIGEGFIHVHHLKPLSEIKKGYIVDPIKDLRPVCPNCHAMLHKGDPVFSIEELKALMDGKT